MPQILFMIIMFYVILCLSFYCLQHLIFFRPEILPASFLFQYPFPFEEVEIKMADGGKINGIYFTVPNALGVVYYLKGNSRSIKGWGKFAKDFLANGYDLLMIDYRGFGKSRGKRTETRLFRDAQRMYEWLTDRYKEEQIILYGRSLGSGIAARIASWNNPRMLIMDSPYFSFFHQVRRFFFYLPLNWILRYRIRTDRFIQQLSCPAYIIHGTHDRLILFKQSLKLAKNFPQKVELRPIPKAHHNDLQRFPEYFETLYDILSTPSPIVR